MKRIPVFGGPFDSIYVKAFVILAVLTFQIVIFANLSRHYRKKVSSPSVAVEFFFDEGKFIDFKENQKNELMEGYAVNPRKTLKDLRKLIEKGGQDARELNEELLRMKESSFGSRYFDKTLFYLFGHRRNTRSVLQSSSRKCPLQSPHLLGDILPEVENIPDLIPGSEGFRRWYGSLFNGGIFKNMECNSRQKVAIIIPYRNREEHLKIWLYNMHPILQRQQLDYQIFVIEQNDSFDFNRAALMNVGFVEASKSDIKFNCLIFHDVDLLPEDDRNLYTCLDGNQIKHMAVAASKWKYSLIYKNYVGGVTALSKAQMKKINGFSNGFYGWGGEDDDLFRRISSQNYTIFRYPGHIGHYTMIKHDFVKSDEENISEMNKKSEDGKLLKDGLSTLKYEKLHETYFPLYTKISVQLPPPPKRQRRKSFLEAGASSLFSKFNDFVKSRMGQLKKSNDNNYENSI